MCGGPHRAERELNGPQKPHSRRALGVCPDPRPGSARSGERPIGHVERHFRQVVAQAYRQALRPGELGKVLADFGFPPTHPEKHLVLFNKSYQRRAAFPVVGLNCTLLVFRYEAEFNVSRLRSRCCHSHDFQPTSVCHASFLFLHSSHHQVRAELPAAASIGVEVCSP